MAKNVKTAKKDGKATANYRKMTAETVSAMKQMFDSGDKAACAHEKLVAAGLTMNIKTAQRVWRDLKWGQSVDQIIEVKKGRGRKLSGGKTHDAALAEVKSSVSGSDGCVSGTSLSKIAVGVGISRTSARRMVGEAGKKVIRPVKTQRATPQTQKSASRNPKPSYRG